MEISKKEFAEAKKKGLDLALCLMHEDCVMITGSKLSMSIHACGDLIGIIKGIEVDKNEKESHI